MYTGRIRLDSTAEILSLDDSGFMVSSTQDSKDARHRRIISRDFILLILVGDLVVGNSRFTRCIWLHITLKIIPNYVNS